MHQGFDELIATVVLFLIGVLGATARYLHLLGKHDKPFSFWRYASHIIIGGVVAVLTGLVTTAMGIDAAWQHAIVGISAVSSKEIIDVIPSITQRYINARAPK